MSLDVHLYGERIGTLFPAGEDDYRFAYTPETVAKAGAGTTLLSNSLPVRPEPFSAEASKAYAEALLPEGAWRRRIAKELGVETRDGYTLLAELGRDCMGAVVFVPEGAGIRSGLDPTAWLTAEEFEELVWQPPKRLVDSLSEERMHFSLPGVHHKLALIRDGGGDRWGWPGPGVPSTHIVKPETGAYPDLVVNEMFCMAVARCAGLPVADTQLRTFAGRTSLVSRRFDRDGTGPGATRIHQEDFCQALGFAPATRSAIGADDSDGPGFAESWGLLKAVGRLDDVPTLLMAAICNYVLGNGNAHGKNFSLLFGPGGPRLAPLYDLVSTVVYDAPIHTGMVLAEDYESEHAYLLELAQVSEECRFDFNAFRDLAGETAGKIADCLGEVAERAREDGWYAPVIDDIVELAGDRAFGLSVEVEY